MSSARRPCLVALFFVIGCSVGCGGAATFENGVFEDDETRYRVGELGGWTRAYVDDNDLAFYHQGMGTIAANSTCSEYEDVPPSALVNHLLFETSARKFVLEETVSLDGRGARHAIVQAELDGVPIELEVFVIKKDGCVFDLSHIRSRTAPEAARAEFLAFVQRFAVLQVKPHG